MDILYDAAIKYRELLHKDYRVTAVYKDEVIEIPFLFLPEHFYHLIGFQKLLDMRQLAKPSVLFTRVMSRKITFSALSESKFLDDMYDRMRDFHRVNELLEHIAIGDVIVQFSQRYRTKINADFLLYDLCDNTHAHLFLKEDSRYGYIPCSFFCRRDEKYFMNNKKYRIRSFSVIERE